MTKPTPTFIWSIAGLLRGEYKQHEYADVILPFTILRRLECVMEPHRESMAAVISRFKNPTRRRIEVRRATGLLFHNASPFTLKKALDDPDNLAANLEEYVNLFSSEIDLFKQYDFVSEIHRMAESSRLNLVTQKFAELDLHPNKVPNAEMGDLFEHLIYKYAEASNEEAGSFYTPRDAIALLIDILFAEDGEALSQPGAVRSIYDPTAGTGGMLSVAEEHLKLENPDAELRLYAQEMNGRTYAICKSDLLVKGQNIDNVRRGDTLAKDEFEGLSFDFVAMNPPYGVEWKTSEESVKDEAKKGFNGRFGAGLPPIDDGSMLFMEHAVSKLRPKGEGGGRAAIVLSGSPLFNGGAGQAQSNIRRWLLETDLVDAIIGLPSDEFYNTGIRTYVWFLTNRDRGERAGKVQLINASGLGSPMAKNLGKKRVEICDTARKDIVREYAAFQQSDISKIFDRREFGYWEMPVNRPLRLTFAITDEGINAAAKSKQLEDIDVAVLRERLESFGKERYTNREEFVGVVASHFAEKSVKLKAAQKTALWKTFGVRDENADICTDRRGRPEPDSSLKDIEIVPFGWGGAALPMDGNDTEARNATIAAYIEAEVKPHVPDAIIDVSLARVGYEILFDKIFYQYVPPRLFDEIDTDLNRLVMEIQDLLAEVER